MRYLSIDLEATGLKQDCYIIQFAMVPFDTETRSLEKSLSHCFYVQCPSFEELKPQLDPWVIEHNEELIRKAHQEGKSLNEFKDFIHDYVSSEEVQKYFGHEKIILFGKSLSAIDLPFLNRDLGWDFMNQYFHHRNLDLSCVCTALIDMQLLPPGADSSSHLMRFFQLGEVAHTALEDAENMALIYLKLLDLIEEKTSK